MPRLLAFVLVLGGTLAAVIAGEPPALEQRRGTRYFEDPARPAKLAALEEQRRDPRYVLTLGGAFDPQRSAAPVREDLGFAREAAGPSAGELLLQLHDDPGPDFEAWLGKLGCEPLRYVPNRTWIVRGAPRALAGLRSDPRVRWAGTYLPALKVRPALLESTYEGILQLEVVLFPGVPPARITDAVKDEIPSLELVSTIGARWGTAVRVAVPAADVPGALVALANRAGVESVDLWADPEPHNNDSIYIVQSYDLVNRLSYNLSATVWNRGIIGTGQIVAVADTRFDTDACFFKYSAAGFANPQYPIPPDPGVLDPAAKVIAHVIVPGGSAAGSSNHGTHVAGSVAGDNLSTPSTPSAAGHDFDDGMAPQARLYLQGLSNSAGTLVVGNNDPYLLSQQAYDAGARIQTNSWGSQVSGEAAPYSFTCQAKDLFTWDHEDFLHVFSVGNDQNFFRKFLAAPAVAKNLVGVAATTHGSAPSNASSIATFTAEGPTLDGRIKPDVAAPGTDITSARWNGIHGDGNCDTTLISGTSMAAPTLAGAATLVRQYYADGFYPGGVATIGDAITPSAALLKATLINGAVDTGTVNMPTDVEEGWGRILLDNALYFPGDARRLAVWDKRNALGLTTGQQDVFQVQATAGVPLKVTLVWTDPPSSTIAAVNLVNNLDLEVVGPSTTFRGNVFAGGASTTGGSPDVLNNVEQVLVNSPAAGTYTLRVKATSVPGNAFTPNSARQGYALVAVHGGCSAPPPAPTGLSAVDNGASGVSLSWTSAASTFEITRAEGSCAAAPGGFSLLARTGSSGFTDASVQGGRSYAYRIRAVNGCGAGPAACAAVSSTAGCTLAPEFGGIASVEDATDRAACGIALTWEPATSRCPAAGVSYNVYRTTTPTFAPSAGNRVAVGVTGTSWVDATADPLTTYHYVVRAEDGTSAHGGPANGGNEDANARTRHGVASGPGRTLGTWTDDAGDSLAWLALDGPWRITSEENHTAGGGLSYKTGADGSFHAAGVCAAATSPPIELGPRAPVLTYWASYNMEIEFDGVMVEISTDDGATWEDLPPDEVAGGAIERYPGFLYHAGACGITPPRGAINNHPFLGLSGWFEFEHELGRYAGQTVRIRWLFTADGFIENAGMYLDDIHVDRAGVPGACGPAGSVSFDRSAYACNDTAAVTVADSSLTGQGSVTVTVVSSVEPSFESLTLTETPPSSGLFTGTIATTSAPPVVGNGQVSVASGSEMTARYADASSGMGGSTVVVDHADVDCVGPEIRNVRAVDVSHDAATILWQTTDWASSTMRLDPTAPPSTPYPGGPALDHSRRITGLAPCTTYFFSIEAVDGAGNSVVDDNGGAHYVVVTGADPFLAVSSTGTPLSIPDLDPVTGITSTLAVADPRRVADVRVEIDATHPSTWELDIALTAPGMTQVVLSDNGGIVLGANMEGTTFADAANTALSAGVPPFRFTYLPHQPLSAFDGLAAAGNWSLNVRDTTNNPPNPPKVGQLDGWSLLLEMQPAWCAAHASAGNAARVSDSCSAGGVGSANGDWDSGEAVQFRVDLKNDGNQTLHGVVVRAVPLTPGVFMLQDTVAVGTIAVGQSVTTSAPHFTAQLPTHLDCRDRARFLVDVETDEGSWSAEISEEIGDGGLPACVVQHCNLPAPVPDGITGTALTVLRNDATGSSIDVDWDATSCPSPEYELLYGPLGGFDPLVPAGAECDLGTTGTHTWTGVPAGNLWFLLVGESDNGTESSWGRDSAGSQRGGIGASGECGNVARDNDDGCF